MIYCFSRTLAPAEKNYSVTDLELLAVVKSMQFFRHYLLGRKFQLRTDHKAIEFINTSKNINTRLLRWSLILQEFSFHAKPISGELNPADGLSRYTSVNKIHNTITNKRLITDETDKQQILYQHHLMLGHGSNNNMHALMKLKYNWGNMYKDIQRYTANCLTCLKGAEKRNNTKNKILISKHTNELWETDLIGPIADINEEKVFILVVTDHFSKWCEAALIKRKTAENVCRELTNIIKRIGTPTKIMSDNGHEFKNKQIESLCSTYGIDWKYNSPAHHKTMGAVERVNQTLFKKLRKLANFKTSQWEKNLKFAIKATNMSYNRSIGTSPYILRHCEAPQIDFDSKNGAQKIKFSKNDLLNFRNRTFDKYCGKAIEKGKIEDKRKFEINDQILIYKSTENNKLASKWCEGFYIKDIVSRDSYIVSNGRKEFRLNKEMILKNTVRLAGEMSVCPNM